MSASIVEKAAVKSDQWTEDDKNAEVIKTLHEQHLKAQTDILAATVKAYNGFYASRKEALAKIPHFWFATFMKHPQLSIFFALDQDQEALTYLEDLSLVRGAEGKDVREFDIVFTFAENPFFSDKTIIKSFKLGPSSHAGHDHEGADEPELTGSKTEISWKDDKHNLIKTFPSKSEEDDEEPGSFFNFFNDEEDRYNIGEVLVDEVIPNALEIFAGLADFSDDEDDFDIDDDEDDEEVDLDPRPTKRSKA